MNVDITKAKIEFPQIGKTAFYQIIIDGVEWGKADATPKGRHGYKFIFKDVAGNIIFRKNEPRQRSSSQVYRAYAKNKAEISVALRAELIAMIKDGCLLHPDIVRKAAKQETERRQRELDTFTKIEKQKWEREATNLLKSLDGYVMTGLASKEKPHAEDITRVVEALKWAQSQ